MDHIIEYFTTAFSTPAKAIGQIIGFGAMFLALVTFSNTDRKKTLRIKLISDILWTVSFLFGSAWTGAVTNGVNSIRDGVFYFKKPSWKRMWFIPAGFLIFYTISGILTWDSQIGIIGLLPILSAFIAVIGLWSSDPLLLKILYIPASVLWIIYAFNVYNIMAIICNMFNLVSIIAGLIKTFRNKTEKGS